MFGIKGLILEVLGLGVLGINAKYCRFRVWN